MNEHAFVTKVVEGKTITWFEATNEYLIFENVTADILKRIARGETIKEIAKAVAKKLGVPYEKSVDFIINLKKDIYDTKTKKATEYFNDYRDLNKPKTYRITKYYQFNKTIIKVLYKDDFEVDLVHLKFAHLEIKNPPENHHTFEVFKEHNFVFLIVDNQFIGSWHLNEVHYFQGKFSMEIIQKMYHLTEAEWLGVFHASAVGNGKKCMLFLGDSGNGKSTSLALLQANGFDCLADDFVPVAKHNTHVYPFNASISIKKNSVEPLLPYYPELKDATEYHLERLNKIVRYLPPKIKDKFQHLPCTDLIFIKYDKNVDMRIKEISKLTAFEKLVPDSWLSPIKENAVVFLEWFQNLNCYELQYSHNDKMINTVHQIFNK